LGADVVESGGIGERCRHGVDAEARRDARDREWVVGGEGKGEGTAVGTGGEGGEGN
jgi:hypothetical protein